MKKKNIKTQTALKCMLAFGAMQVAHAYSDTATNLNVTAGAELRLRYDGTDNLPTSSRGESGSTEYARIRIRPWMMASYEDFGFLFRLADEFRAYRVPDSMSRKQRWPDVLFIDNLYVAWNGAFDVLDFKLGRQDMSFGAKRIVSDGTGGDGSRSAYFDGLRVTWHADENRTLDMFGIYQTFDDRLPTLGKEHANGEKPHDYDMTGYGQDEYGLGLYWQDRSNEDFGYDAYYVAKGERRPSHAKYRKEGSHADSHTFGVRLLPRFAETLYGELELAGQVGSEIKLAGQCYAGLTWKPETACKPSLTGALWCSQHHFAQGQTPSALSEYRRFHHQGISASGYASGSGHGRSVSEHGFRTARHRQNLLLSIRGVCRCQWRSRLRTLIRTVSGSCAVHRWRNACRHTPASASIHRRRSRVGHPRTGSSAHNHS